MHGRPPPTMRCTDNMPFSSKLLTLQGNGKHSDASFVMLYHIPDLEPNWRQKICPVAKGLNLTIIFLENLETLFELVRIFSNLWASFKLLAKDMQSYSLRKVSICK